MPITPNYILALDVGEKRIGVAIASSIARLPRPLTTLDATSDSVFDAVQEIITSESIDTIVVGLPRGLQGQHTAQTAAIEQFTEQLRQAIKLPIHQQDEALTSRKAEAELASRGKPFAKGEVDALAATYILEDWLQDHPAPEQKN